MESVRTRQSYSNKSVAEDTSMFMRQLTYLSDPAMIWS